MKQRVSYENIFKEHNGNTSDKCVAYFEVYDRYFGPFVDKKPDILEIGVQNGGHLQIMSKYFGNANIYGVDIDEKVLNLNLGDKINIFCFDATDQQLFDSTLKEQKFDIIIDDGSQVQKDIIAFFEHSFKRLKPGGVFLIEDLLTSYWDSHGGGYKKPDSAIEYFKNLLDLVNIAHIRDAIALSEFEKYLAVWMGAIEFSDSIVVITKRDNEQHALQRILVGTKDPVAPNIEYAKEHGYYYENK